MTKRDFFRILIKIFGLYSLVLSIFTVIPQNISNILYQFDIMILLIILASTLISVGLFLILLFKTDFIIDKLKLDKGFDDIQINFGNLTNESILKLAIFIIGGFLIIDYTPSLLFDLVNAFKNKATFSTIEGSSIDYFQIFVSLINIVIGYLFITNYKSISKFLDKKQS
ncbi:hypothetical protein [Flavobacterium sp.]|uniref:hypothetical protein n=1 Tax=Flavobacterium sp. TaxID=239 RepID=UPI0026135711|nr:hypothetical protein [Flavobacterium sp.]